VSLLLTLHRLSRLIWKACAARAPTVPLVTLFMDNSVGDSLLLERDSLLRKRDRDEDQASDAVQNSADGACKRQKSVQAEVGGSRDEVQPSSEGTSSGVCKGAGKRGHEPPRTADAPANDQRDWQPEAGTSKRQRVREPAAEADKYNEAQTLYSDAYKRLHVQKAAGAHNAADSENARPARPATKYSGSNALLVHEVPPQVPMQQLYSLFCRRASLREPEYAADEWHYKTMAFFHTPADADLVFDSLDGPISLDDNKLQQKRVYVGPYKVRVRMTPSYLV
jgi:hypothetical protein